MAREAERAARRPATLAETLFLDAADALSARRIPAIVLRSPAEPGEAASHAGGPAIELLIQRHDLTGVVALVEPMSWRYAWQLTGALRLTPLRHYWWDGGATVSIYHGLPAAPFPASMLARLRDALWTGAEPRPDGLFEPEAAALLVHLAVQACRPVRGSDWHWSHFLECRDRVAQLSRAEVIARQAGVLRALRRALAAADRGGERPGVGPLYDGPLDLAWRAAVAVQRRIRPRRLGRQLTGMPSLGDFTIRSRTAGVEVLSGPGVFVPTPDADLFIEQVLDATRHDPSPTIVEVGTGCGAIALALAALKPGAEVHATELSANAVRWARRNARRLGLERVRVHRGSLVAPVASSVGGRADVLVANLPFYPASGSATIGAVPRGTIEGFGDDGLDLVRRLLHDAIPLLRPGALLLLQMFPWQWELLGEPLRQLGYRPGAAKRSGAFAICPAEFLGFMTGVAPR